MQKFFFVFLFSVGMLHAGSSIDERITDIYFGNGVWNDIENANKGRLALEKHILYDVYNGNTEEYKKHHYTPRDNPEDNKNIVLLQYNWTGISPEAGLGNIDEFFGYFWDLVEMFDQLQREGQLPNFTFFGWLQNSQLPPLREWFDKYLISVDGANVQEMFNRYKKISFNNSHRVLLVSHSQGNAFANRVYDAINPTEYREYFANLQVASPVSSVHAKNGSYVTLKGDKIINPILGSMKGNADLNPKDDKVLDVNHEFVSEYLRQTDPLAMIIKQLKLHIDNLKKPSSQWKPKEEDPSCGTTICEDKRIKVTHVFDAINMDRNMKETLVYPFNIESGKLYKVDEKYVIASFGGETILEKPDKDTCYKIIETEEMINGKNKGKSDENGTSSSFTVHSGAIETTLGWNYALDIDMDLEMAGPNVHKDVEGIPNVGLEHAFVKSSFDVKPGDLFELSATGGKSEESELEESCLDTEPVSIYAIVKTPGGSKFKQFKARSFGELNIGKYAEIEVRKQIAPKWVYHPSTYNPPSTNVDFGSGSVRTYNRCSEENNKKTCGCVPCEYIVRGMENSVEYGPIAGADVKIVEAQSYGEDNVNVLYHGVTTSHKDMLKAGLVKLTNSDKVKFEDERYYIISAKGGNDVDRNDDLIQDDNPTPNNGTIHAIIKGSDLKLLSFRVNVLTEAIFQVSGDVIGSHYNKEALARKLDNAAQKLIKEKLYPTDSNMNITYRDVLLWAPAVDKRVLYKPYDTFVEPVVLKTYSDTPRFTESYRLIYEPYSSDAPLLTPVSLNIPQGLADHTAIAKVVTQNYKTFSRVEIKGDYVEYFSMDDDGILRIASSISIHEGDRYSFNMRAIDSAGNVGSWIGFNIQVSEAVPLENPSASVPFFVSLETFDVVENTPKGTIVANAYFKDDNQTIVSYRLLGDDNNSFTIDSQGIVRVGTNADIDYEKSNVYRFSIVAKNDAGNESYPILVSVNISNEIDTPLYPLVFFKHIEENIPIGTIIGKLELKRDGLSQVDSIEILSPDMPFEVDKNGIIVVSDHIDFEQNDEYRFIARAHTKHGKSNKIDCQIIIDNQEPEDGVPTLEDITIEVDENILSGSKIGQLQFSHGATNIERIVIYGESDNFRVDVNASIYLAPYAHLDYEKKTRYDLKSRALNSRGYGNEAKIVINVRDVAMEAPSLASFEGNIEENATVGMVIGKIEIASKGEADVISYALIGIGSENFTVDSNGTIRVSISSQLDYESKRYYRFYVTASSQVGTGSYAEVFINVMNVPEQAPTLKIFTTSVEENITVGTEIGNIEVSTSGDTPITSYELNDTSPFSIDNNGMIKVNATLDYEAQVKYILYAKATNAAGKSAASMVMIDINDTGIAPVLLSTTIVIEDARDAGHEVGNIIVGDDGDSPIIEMKLAGGGAEEFKVDEKGIVSIVSSYTLDYAREYNLLATAKNKFGISEPVEINIIVKPNASSVAAGSNITVLEHQAFSLRGNIGEINATEVLSYQWYSSDTNKIDCDGSSYECLVAGLDIGEYEAIFSVIYKNGEKLDDSIMIQVISNPLNNILGTLQEGLEGLKEMKLSKDGTKMYVIGDFEDDVIFKIVDVSDVKEMKLIGTYTNSDIGNNVSSFALNEDESKVAIAGGKVVVLDISDPIAIKYISERGSHATKLARSVQWYKDDKILIYNYNSWSDPYYTILIFDIYQMNSGAIKEFVLDTSPRDFLVIPNEDILVVGMSNKLKVFDINKSTMLYETDKVLVDNIVLSELNSKVYYNYEYYKIAGLDISNKAAIRDINLSEKIIFDYQSLYDVNDSSDTLYTYYAYSNSYSTINKISIQDLQHQYVGDTTYIKGKIQHIEATKDQKSAFVYSGNGLQAIDIKKNEYKGKLIDNLNVGYLAWSHNDSYAYASGFIYDCRDIFTITNIGKFSALNSCYPDCGESGSSLMLDHFYLSNDDTQISFMYVDVNREKKYANIDVSDKSQNNFMQLDDNDPGENVSRFTISKNERYVYSGYKEEDINGVSYFGIMVLDRDTQDKQYFRVGENEGNEFAHFVLSNNEEKLYALFGGSIVVFDIQNNKKITAMNHIVSTSVINAFILIANQNKIFALTESGLDIIDTSNSKMIYHYATPEKPKKLSMSPDGIKLAISMGNVVEIVNILNQEVVTRYGFIWYPSFSYGSGNVSFKSNSILFSEGYIINLEE